MQMNGYLPLSEDAQCAWEGAGREATTFGTGPNGPICLMIGLLELNEGRTAEILRAQTNLTADQLRAVLSNWKESDEGEVLLNLAIVRDRAQALARAAKRKAITAEDLLAALADPESVDTRLYRLLKRAGPTLDLAKLREAASSQDERPPEGAP